MTEFAASIVGIVTAGVKITIVLFHISEELGSAGREAHLVATEITTFCSVFRTLHSTLTDIEESAYFASCRDALTDMTATTMRMYDEVLDAAEELRKLSRKGAIGVKGKVGWVIFHRPKITMLRAALESYKSTLSLMLETISITAKLTRSGGATEFAEEIERKFSNLNQLEACSEVFTVDAGRSPGGGGLLPGLYPG